MLCHLDRLTGLGNAPFSWPFVDTNRNRNWNRVQNIMHNNGTKQKKNEKNKQENYRQRNNLNNAKTQNTWLRHRLELRWVDLSRETYIHICKTDRQTDRTSPARQWKMTQKSELRRDASGKRKNANWSALDNGSRSFRYRYFAIRFCMFDQVSSIFCWANGN